MISSAHFAACLEREKLASLQQLAYGASHEINNPLANISTRAQTLLHAETNADRRRKLAAINRQAFRAHEMIADLMLFAKPPRLETQFVDVQTLLTRVVDELTQEADEARARMILEPAMKTFQIRPDPTQLAVTVKAICINAMEAMGTGGTVQLIVEEKEGDLVELMSAIPSRHRPRYTPPSVDHFYSSLEAGRGLGRALESLAHHQSARRRNLCGKPPWKRGDFPFASATRRPQWAKPLRVRRPCVLAVGRIRPSGLDVASRTMSPRIGRAAANFELSLGLQTRSRSSLELC